MQKEKSYTLFITLIVCIVSAVSLLRRRRRRMPLSPVQGRISQGYGPSHQAVDIAVPAGTEVRCPWDGRVSRVWWDDTYGGGRSMLVEHDNGYTTGYAHLEGYHFGSGDRVLQGQNLALSGNSGSHTTGPHLHFTLRNAAGEKIDPQTLFSF